MKRRNVTLMVVGNFFSIFVRVALPRGADEIVGLPPRITYRLVRTMVADVRRVESLRYIPDPSLKRQTLTSKQGLLRPIIAIAMAFRWRNSRRASFRALCPPQPFRALASLSQQQARCVIHAASWWVSGDGQCQDETR